MAWSPCHCNTQLARFGSLCSTYLFNMTDDTLRKFQIKKLNWLIGHPQVHWTCWTVLKTTEFEKRASYSASQHCIFGKERVQQPGGHSGTESLKILALPSCSTQIKFLETRLNSHENAPYQRTQIEQIQKLAINRRLSVLQRERHNGAPFLPL